MSWPRRFSLHLSNTDVCTLTKHDEDVLKENSTLYSDHVQRELYV